MIIDINNNVLAFGSNVFGQLGLGDYQKRNTPTQIEYKGKICCMW